MKYRLLRKIRNKLLLKSRKEYRFKGLHKKSCFCKYVNKQGNGTIIRIKIQGIEFININYGIEQGHMLINLLTEHLINNHKNMILSKLTKFTFDIYTNITDSTDIKTLIKNMSNTLTNALEDIYKIHIQFDIAAVIYKDWDLDIYDAISKLSICMSSLAKKRSEYEIYNEKHENYMSIKSIEDAIKNREIKMYYQPKVSLKNEKIVGVEALIRWFSPEYGYIPPDKIIDFCEECGYINILGKWTLEKSCKDIKYLNEIMGTNIDLSVNISPHQLDSENFTKDLIESVRKVNFDFKLLKLEITESENIEGIRKINDIITDVKRTGIKISLDDFGKGFNSINYIKNYNVDEIKLDKSLVEYINKNPMFIENLIKMIHTTKTSIVAEGVETKSEYLKLKNIDCDIVQGYYCYEPVDLDKLIDIIRNDNCIINKEVKYELVY
jgi:EAL domain-containing protein (putative c-di-GMP-specific phosphodiesterase class I)